MAAEASSGVLNIQRQTSTSPRQQTSNLTSALQSSANHGGTQTPAMNIAQGASGNTIPLHRKESVSMSGLTPQQGSGAMPIATGRSQPRRESLGGSMMNGMSWGGVSMNSWIRDDIIMQGSSPYAGGFQSPSFHSSSYLPKLEANFMKDFTCCGLTLPSLHDLLQHFEEAHAQQVPPPIAVQQSQRSTGNLVGNIPTSSGGEGQSQTNQLPISTSSTQPAATVTSSTLPLQPTQTVNIEDTRRNQPSQDLESVEDMEMEMDDVNGPHDFSTNATGYAMPETEQYPQRNQFSRPSAPPLDLTALNNPFQAIRQSQPNTPVSGGRPFHNNPTVSSVNTPTLSAHPLQQQFRTTPDSSAPGTPGELDPDFVGNLGNMTMENPAFVPNQPLDFNSRFGFTGQSELLELCIDDPAKRLFSPGGANNQQGNQNKLGNAQYGPNSEIAKRIREQQRKVGLPDTVSGLNGEEPKPFRCPVIGCEKAYKNQNGLKYHKSHGHNNQQLHENADGTFSIVDPTTLSPYPGTLGMEKEKPYKCEVCGKRYKNLNGLKYHKTHSPPCNPDLKLNAGAPINATAMNANVAGGGLPGIGEEM